MYREPLRWQTHLGIWVADITPSRVVAELRSAGQPLTEGAVYKWVSGECVPRPEVALHLVEISRGELTLTDIYTHRAQLQGLQVHRHAPASGGARISA